MDTLNKDDFINIYVLNTLNEIKTSVKENIKLDKGREAATDKKMAAVLTDLINANLKGLPKDSKDNIIYTLLSVTGKGDKKKIRLSLVLYYAALYYDNVDLLQDLMRADVRFYNYYDSFNLCYLDKTMSSKFDRKEYIEFLQECGFVFENFYRSIDNVSLEEKEKYILKIKKILEVKHGMIAEIFKNGRGNSIIKIFSKNHLDVFSDNTYEQASYEQLRMINYYADEKISSESRDRLNKLMQTKRFSNNLCNYDLMLKVLTDEQLEDIEYFASEAISVHYDKNENPSKILDFVSRRPDLSYAISLVPKEKFKKINNYALIEMCDYCRNQRKTRCLYSSEACDFYLKEVRSTVLIKRVLGKYKKTSKQ